MNTTLSQQENRSITILLNLLFCVQFLGTGLSLLGFRIAEGNKLSTIWILLFVFLFTLAGLSLLLLTPKFHSPFSHFINKLSFGKAYQIIVPILIFSSAALFILASVPGSALSPSQLPFYERFYLLIPLALFISVELLAALILLHRDVNMSGNLLRTRPFRFAAIAILCLMIMMLFSMITGLGIIPDPVSWRTAGTPLLTWQIVGGILAGVGLLWLQQNFSTRRFRQILNWVIPLALFLGAYFSWMSLPLQTAYTAPRIRPPNSEVYPYSDALYYSLSAESVLNGDGLFGWSVVPRPLFMTELTYIFAIAQGSYTDVISLQTLVLALIPVMLFLVGKELYGHPLGLVMGLLGILREYTAINSTSYIQVSNSKLILSDLPAMLMFLILTWSVIRWVKADGWRLAYPFLVGGLLGTMMLIRTQSILLLPFLVFIGFLKYRSWKVSLKTTGLMVAALFITLSPWIARNYTITGQFMFDDNRQIGMVIDRYQEADTTIGDESSGASSGQSILHATLQNPGFVAKFVSNHFFRNVICTLLVTPPTLRGNDLDLLFSGTNLWTTERIALSSLEIILLVIMLGVIGLGFIGLARKNWLSASVPVILFVGYNLSNSLARNSGGRYNLPIDWMGYMLLAAGVLFVAAALVKPGKSIDEIKKESTHGNSSTLQAWKPVIVLAIAFLALGSSIPLTEQFFSWRNKHSNPDNPLLLVTDPEILSLANQILADPQVEMIYGKAYYPRFYPAGQGEPGSHWVAYSPQEYDRLGFILMNEQGKTEVIYRTNNRPRFFPNRVEVIILGEWQKAQVKNDMEEYFHSRLIIFPGEEPIFYYITARVE
ncbi:MAG: hypothetical protein C0391_05995 [Anaerolinea sp.]|nr:hypothetical protein [Anaerolinea sp.]